MIKCQSRSFATSIGLDIPTCIMGDLSSRALQGWGRFSSNHLLPDSSQTANKVSEFLQLKRERARCAACRMEIDYHSFITIFKADSELSSILGHHVLHRSLGTPSARLSSQNFHLQRFCSYVQHVLPLLTRRIRTHAVLFADPAAYSDQQFRLISKTVNRERGLELFSAIHVGMSRQPPLPLQRFFIDRQRPPKDHRYQPPWARNKAPCFRNGICSRPSRRSGHASTASSLRTRISTSKGAVSRAGDGFIQ